MAVFTNIEQINERILQVERQINALHKAIIFPTNDNDEAIIEVLNEKKESLNRLLFLKGQPQN